MRNPKAVTRRKFLTAGAGTMALAGFGVREVRAVELSATEKANIAVVDAFHKNMSDPTQNLDKVARLGETCSQDIIWGTAGGDKLHGLAAVQEWYTNFFKGGGTSGLRTMVYEYSETFAHGPVVVEYGLHFIVPPGGPMPAPNNFHCVVHIVKDGKITERYDNFVR